MIDWTCDTCHEPTDGRGAIHIAYAEIRRAEQNRKEWLDRPGEGFARWSVADAVAPPNLGLWKVECNTCADTCEGSYWIDLAQAQTAADLDRWTKHLSGKTWYVATNWVALTCAAVETQQHRTAV